MGVLLLLASQNVFDYDMVWKTVVPLIIIMLGIKLIVKTTFTSKQTENTYEEKDKSENIAAFSSKKFDYTD